MAPINRLMPLVLAVVLGLVLQAGFTVLDCKETPYHAAIDFTRAYYRLDPAMAHRLCQTGEPEQQTAIVADFIYRTRSETKNRGFDLGMAKSTLYHVKTNTVQKSDTEADVHLTASRRTAINPVFPFVARFFDLGKTYHVDETIQMVKEDGRWKVCGPVFDLTADS